MHLRLEKPWVPLTAESAAALPGQLGVYQIADAAGRVAKIGVAGARAPFGLRSALQGELAERGPGWSFRVEVNMQYTTRHLELLMLHRADHGDLPEGNRADPPPRLGRLRPASPR